MAKITEMWIESTSDGGFVLRFKYDEPELVMTPDGWANSEGGTVGIGLKAIYLLSAEKNDMVKRFMKSFIESEGKIYRVVPDESK